jgi:hypothetical protein
LLLLLLLRRCRNRNLVSKNSKRLSTIERKLSCSALSFRRIVIHLGILHCGTYESDGMAAAAASPDADASFARAMVWALIFCSF